MGGTETKADKIGIRRRQPSNESSENSNVTKDDVAATAKRNEKQEKQFVNNSEHETFSSVFEELDTKNNWKKKRSSLIFGAFLILTHFISGVLCMIYLEEWELHDAVYFCMVTLTTVGYGDLSPTNTYSKIFVVYYVLVSMTLISSYLTELVTVVIDHNSVALTRRLSHTPNRASHLLKSTSRSLGLMSANESDVTGALSVLASSALVCVLLGVGFAIYVVYEDLSSVDAVYATIISASTVGFGDLKPTNTRSKLMMTIWLVFATISVAKLVGDFEDARVKATERAALRRVLDARMDKNSVQQVFGKEKGSEIEWGEFVSAVLVATGKVEREDVQLLKVRFQQLVNE